MHPRADRVPLRPSRLAFLTRLLLAFLLLLSFFTGVALWYGQFVQDRDLTPIDWLSPVRFVHGALNPFLTAFFGYLLCRHIRYGWERKANRWSGLPMELALGYLILSAIGLYYAGDETWRAIWIWSHRIVGAVLPVLFVLHWVLGIRHGRRLEQEVEKADSGRF